MQGSPPLSRMAESVQEPGGGGGGYTSKQPPSRGPEVLLHRVLAIVSCHGTSAGGGGRQLQVFGNEIALHVVSCKIQLPIKAMGSIIGVNRIIT